MANYTTGAQRYNKRMDAIFAKSEELNKKYHGKDSFGSAKSKALHSKSTEKSIRRKMKARIDRNEG